MQQEQDPTTIDPNGNIGSSGQPPTISPQPAINGQTEPPPMPNPTTVITDPGIIASGEIPRSSEWPAVEQAHLRAHPTCAACGQGQPGQGLQVHHMLPFHFCVTLGRPELELDERNLMTLCDESINSHHLLLGHLGNFQSYNPNVKADVAGPLGQLGAAQIESNPDWQTEMHQRPPFLDRMNEQQIADFKALMDAWYPPETNSNTNSGS